MNELRSSCPINFGLEIFGDQWSLLVIRDIAFNEKRTYGEFLASAENISTNILANRLKSLEAAGIIEKTQRDDKRVHFYALTPKGKALAPVLVECVLWGAKFGKQSKSLLAWAAEIEKDKQAVINGILNMDN